MKKPENAIIKGMFAQSQFSSKDFGLKYWGVDNYRKLRKATESCRNLPKAN